MTTPLNTLTDNMKMWLDVSVNGAWSINSSTGLIDVDGHFEAHRYSIVYDAGVLPVSFGTVSGNFIASYCNLKSLRGCPLVCEFMSVEGNTLEKFEWNPIRIGCMAFSCKHVKDDVRGVYVKEIDHMLENGVIGSLMYENAYLKMREVYYERELIELL